MRRCLLSMIFLIFSSSAFAGYAFCDAQAANLIKEYENIYLPMDRLKLMSRSDYQSLGECMLKARSVYQSRRDTPKISKSITTPNDLVGLMAAMGFAGSGKQGVLTSFASEIYRTLVDQGNDINTRFLPPLNQCIADLDSAVQAMKGKLNTYKEQTSAAPMADSSRVLRDQIFNDDSILAVDIPRKKEQARQAMIEFTLCTDQMISVAQRYLK